LAGVNQNIKSATLEGDDRAAASVSEQMQTADNQETVDVREALTEVETATREEVLANARLAAWESYGHPDIDTVGAATHPDVPFTTGSVEAVFTTVFPDVLDEFTVVPVTEHGKSSEISESHREAVYYVEVSAEIVDIDPQQEEGTVASEITGEENAIAVTFDPGCAQEYPSLRFLLPGDPIFEELVDHVCSVTDLDEYEWVQFGADWSNNKLVKGRVPWIVGSLLDDETGMILDKDGNISGTEIDTDMLGEWSREFIRDRKSDRHNSDS
ncbi:MAG: hypothetical protein ABEI86_00225, partial [Halobacteriaceae archaeon]